MLYTTMQWVCQPNNYLICNKINQLCLKFCGYAGHGMKQRAGVGGCPLLVES
jgi:hypothetical protein